MEDQPKSQSFYMQPCELTDQISFVAARLSNCLKLCVKPSNSQGPIDIYKLPACNASQSSKRKKHKNRSPIRIDIVFSASSSSSLLIKKRRINKFICLKQHSQKSNETLQMAHSTAILNSRGFVRGKAADQGNTTSSVNLRLQKFY